jgi:hypothetical protein
MNKYSFEGYKIVTRCSVCKSAKDDVTGFYKPVGEYDTKGVAFSDGFLSLECFKYCLEGIEEEISNTLIEKYRGKLPDRCIDNYVIDKDNNQDIEDLKTEVERWLKN